MLAAAIVRASWCAVLSLGPGFGSRMRVILFAVEHLEGPITVPYIPLHPISRFPVRHPSPQPTVALSTLSHLGALLLDLVLKMDKGATIIKAYI